MIELHPQHRLVHPENHIFLPSIVMFMRSKYPKNISFNFEIRTTGDDAIRAVSRCEELWFGLLTLESWLPVRGRGFCLIHPQLDFMSATMPVQDFIFKFR